MTKISLKKNKGTNQSSATTLKEKKRKTIEYGRYGYLFILPFFLVYAIFQLYPLFYTIWLSTQEYYSRGLKEIGPNFVGLKNFKDVLVGTSNGKSVLFGTITFEALKNTFIMWGCNFIPQILLSLLLASWFTDTKVKLRGQGAFKVIMYLPNVVTAASIAVLFYSLLNINGPVTILLRRIGVISAEYDFMTKRLPTQLIIAFIQFWMWYGNTMILLIAGILGISPTLFEAAMVDGASSRQIFYKITLPLLKPILLFALVTSAIGGLQMYDIPAVYNVDQSGLGLPDGASMTITMYIRRLTLSSKDLGKAAAASMVLFLVTLIISMIFFFTLGDREKKIKRVKKKETM